ncbi:hypothetical protein [Micromonospora noduli]|uniref:hypothetical protein n=1 Tax=Micromonospora noduli TaxID=709876 RepID=UPI001CEDFBB2|nr:hypothetical protein [Micromonospora noduli]
MPIEHVDAAADLAPLELKSTTEAIERHRTLLESTFGPTIIAEHGARDCDLGASCCTHCHLHLIPVPDPDAVVAAYREVGGAGQRLSGMDDLPAAATGAYLYLSIRPNEHLIWGARGFPRQFVRRVTARLHGIGDQYDWRDHPFHEAQQDTLRILRTAAVRPAA